MRIWAKRIRTVRPSMKWKLVLSLLSIAVVLLISGIITVMEYSRMSNYVSELIADDISSINVANKLADMTNDYNLGILASIGGEGPRALPEFDDEYFKSHCDTLRVSGAANVARPLADSVMYSYAAYMLTALEFENVLESDFIDTRAWYFGRLQPRYERVRDDIHRLSGAVYRDLERNSATFERGFYRSIIPGIVAVGVGIMLSLLMLFFMLSYYANPICRMLDAMDAYRARGKKYTYEFDGDDELRRLNDGIRELAGENRQMRARIRSLRQK